LKKQQEIGFLIHQIQRRWFRLVFMKQAQFGLDQETIANGRILGYLHYAKNPVYQKDIEKEAGLTKSAVSNLLSALEKKGFLERKSVEGDARLKQIVLTDLGEEMHLKMQKSMSYVDKNFSKGISEEEQDELFRILTIINQNMKEMEAEKSD